MRKRDPELVRTQFKGELDDLADYFEGAFSHLGDAHRTRLAETVFLATAVSLERFVSDLLLAYLNRDFSAYQARLEEQIQASVADRHGAWQSSRVAFRAVTHVKAADLDSIVDPDGRNLTFKGFEGLRSFAERLGETYRQRLVAIGTHDQALMDTVKAIRNFLAHQSRGSKDEMNEALATVAQKHPANAGLGRGTRVIHNVGAFLKADSEGERRILKYIARLREMADRL